MDTVNNALALQEKLVTVHKVYQEKLARMNPAIREKYISRMHIEQDRELGFALLEYLEEHAGQEFSFDIRENIDNEPTWGPTQLTYKKTISIYSRTGEE